MFSFFKNKDNSDIVLIMTILLFVFALSLILTYLTLNGFQRESFSGLILILIYLKIRSLLIENEEAKSDSKVMSIGIKIETFLLFSLYPFIVIKLYESLLLNDLFLYVFATFFFNVFGLNLNSINNLNYKIENKDCVVKIAYDLSKIEFKDDKKFLSNMYPCNIFMDARLSKLYPSFNFTNLNYKSTEHLYQSLKSGDKEWIELILRTESPEKTKSLARKHLDKNYKIREDWDQVKIEAMKLCTYLKYSQNKGLRYKLQNLEGKIEEKNCWGDKFWGTVDGVGENYLGKILMNMRSLDNNYHNVNY